jgi:biopolymer transport protein ExbD
MRLRRPERRRGRVEIIPMIDTMFFLLVFFMMATLSMTLQRGLTVNLPRAATAREDPAQVSTVTLAQDGALYLDKERMTSPAEVALRLARDPAGNGARSVLVNADRSVEHGRVVEVLDVVRQAGITRVAIAAAPADGERRSPGHP